MDYAQVLENITIAAAAFAACVGQPPLNKKVHWYTTEGGLVLTEQNKIHDRS